MAEPIVIDKEMGITRADFLRTLGRAFPVRALEVDGNEVRVADGTRRVDIALSEESERAIALVRLPVLHVRLTLLGYAAAEADALIAGFDRAFQRGGG